MFETHSQPIKGHLYTGMAENFTGAIKKEIEIHSPIEGITKSNLHTTHIFNTITNLAISTNAEISTILWIYKC